jgi:putative DNA primase/helicase
LVNAHRENLRARGLNDEQIESGRYGSLPIKKRSSIAKELLALFAQDVLERVPGLGWRNGANGPYFTIHGAAGLLIPVRNADGQIVALKVRADEAPHGQRYTYISSAKYGGPGPGAPEHYPLGWRDLAGPVRVTEGELKADIATALSGVATIGVAGIGRLPGAAESLAGLGRKLILAPDADARTNANVARHVYEAIERVRELGVDFAIEYWNAVEGKGIDDVLAKGAIVECLEGELAADYAAELRRVAGIEDEAASAADAEPQEERPSIVALGSRHPKTGRLVLSPVRTLPTAEAFVREYCNHAEGRTLHSYGDVLYLWLENRYVEIEEGFVNNTLLPWLHECHRYIRTRDGYLELTDFESNPGTVKAALESIKYYVHLDVTTEVPSWLTSAPGRPPADELLCCKTKNVILTTGETLEPSPALFNFNALDFDYDPLAGRPDRWFTFLDQLFPGDPASVELLQEFCGYCLVSDTRQQKALLLVGPRRSGKGTIGRVLRRLVGEHNVSSPTVAGLAQNFGLQPLVGKTVAVVSDARFAGEGITAVVERLLCIIGEDAITIDRKYLAPITVRLLVRFVFMTNELPRFSDSSAALAGRFLILQLRRSFYGEENPNLTDELLEELPGILLWALDGLRRLRARGRFVEPQSSEEAKRELEELSSPVGTFVREKCAVGAMYRIPVASLYCAWTEWSKANGSAHVSSGSGNLKLTHPAAES